MSLYIQDRVKEQEFDDQSSDKNIVFTFPWIFDYPIQNEGQWMNRDSAAEAPMTTSYKMGTTHWNICLKTDYNAIVVRNAFGEVWDASCFISFTLYYDAEMRFEFFSSTRIKMDENEYMVCFCTPEGYMTRFIEAANKKKFSKCVISVELHLPTKYFLQPSFKREFNVTEGEIIDKFPDNFEKNFRFEFLKKGDYTFECLDGTVLAHRDILFLSSFTMKQQLSFRHHYPVGTLKYTVEVIKPIIIFFHSLCFKLPDSFNFDYILRLLSATEFFEPVQKCDMIAKIKEVISEKLVKENHDFNSLLSWFTFAFKCKTSYRFRLSPTIGSLIANMYYFKWQQTFPETARNAQNPVYHQIFGESENADVIFKYIDYIFAESFVTNVILQ